MSDVVFYWKGRVIVDGLPREILEPLLLRDGTTKLKPFNNDGKAKSLPELLYALGLVDGVAGSHVTGWDWGEWLTVLGQSVVDCMKADDAENHPRQETSD